MYCKTRFKKAVSVLLACLFVLGSVNIHVFAQGESDMYGDYEMSENLTGNGTAQFPYEIWSAGDLARFGHEVNTCEDKTREFYAELKDDIVLNEIDDWEDGSFNASKLIEWTPIAPAKRLYFPDPLNLRCEYSNSIHFNGNNHTIYGLYINKSSEDDVEINDRYLGLFSVDFSVSSSYENINIAQSFLCGEYSVGGIIAYTYASIYNCKVDSSYIKGNQRVGGIVGQCSYYGNIDNCINTGSIIGTSEVGGIAGYAESVTDCINKGTVKGSRYTGGIAGRAAAIRLCYNEGAVDGRTDVGGICGFESDVFQCYNRGDITGKIEVGGIIGRGFANECYNIGTVTGNDCDPICKTMYDDNNTYYAYNSYNTNCCYLGEKTNSSATALKSYQMTQEYCFNDWDFDNVWTIVEEGDYNYPQFIKDIVRLDERDYYEKCNYVRVWNGGIADGFESGDGETKETAYKIRTAEQLAYLAQTVNEGNTYQGKFFCLENDIVLNNTDLDNWFVYASEWTPIGYRYANSVKSGLFSGVFDGNGKSISGLKTAPKGHSCGLFGFISHGTVENLNIINSYILGSYSVGGICGFAGYSAFNDCSFSGRVYSQSGTGGIVGQGSYCDFTRCINQGDIFANDYTGGIVGWLENGCIRYSYNTGRIIGTRCIGGIVGRVVEIVGIERCFNSGYVFARIESGGIAGYLGNNQKFEISIYDCYNSGFVGCLFDECGGIVGNVYAQKNDSQASIKECYNCGIVSLERNSDFAEALGEGTADGNIRDGFVGCILGCTEGQDNDCKIENCFYLENSFCEKGRGSFGDTTDDIEINNQMKLTIEEMQTEESFVGFSFGEGENAIWALNGEGCSNEYLFPQLKGLLHKPGNQYMFNFLHFKGEDTNNQKIASASPFAFSNVPDNFTKDYFRMEGVYEELFYRALNGIKRIAKRLLARLLVISSKRIGPWGGNCCGMSAVMMLHMLDLIDVGDFQWQAEEPRDFLTPVKSNTVESLINYFHLYQNIIQAETSILPLDNSKAIGRLAAAFETSNCVLLKKCYKNNDSLFKNTGPIHWVVAYDKGRLTANGGTVGIWDPNEPQSVSEMTVKKDGAAYSIVGEDDYTITQVITVGNLEQAYKALNQNVKSLNLQAFSSDKRKAAPEQNNVVFAQNEEDNGVTTLISGYDSFTITHNGKTATVAGGMVQGSTTLISNGDTIGENIPLYQFILSENSGAYTITQLKSTQSEDIGEAHMVAICGDGETNNWYSIVDADSLTKIIFDLDNQTVKTASDVEVDQTIISGFAEGRVETAGQPVVVGQMAAEAETPTSWNSIELSGVTKGITASMDESNCRFWTASDTDKITVKASDGINETTGCEINNAAQGIKIDENNPREMNITANGTRARKIAKKTGAANKNSDTTLGYTVFFVSGTDEGNQSISVLPGEMVPNPGAPEDAYKHTDYIFSGWWYRDDKDCDWKEWNFDENIVNGNTRLVAKWEKDSGDDKETCAPVTASPPTGSTADEGTAVTLSTTTPGAQIYYTTDGTDPCIEDNPSRIHYAGPITLTENVRIIAYAIKSGWYDSEMTILNYTVIPKTYTITWYIDGDVIIQTVAHGAMIEKIDDPVKAGYTFKGWSSPVPETMPAYDLTFTAVFEQEQPTIAIRNYTQNRTVDYFTTITFTAEVQNPVSGAEIRWIVGDQVMGTDDTFTMKRADKTFTVQAQYVKNDRVLAESEAETVTVRTSFLAKLIAFIRALLGRLPIVVQEYLGVEIIDRVLT